MEPYYPCIEPRLNAVLGAHGYETALALRSCASWRLA
jgi:hypothetical protein